MPFILAADCDFVVNRTLALISLLCIFQPSAVLQKRFHRASKVAQQVSMLAAKANDLSASPRTCMIEEGRYLSLSCVCGVSI